MNINNNPTHLKSHYSAIHFIFFFIFEHSKKLKNQKSSEVVLLVEPLKAP